MFLLIRLCTGWPGPDGALPNHPNTIMLGSDPDPDLEIDTLTHGICPDCHTVQTAMVVKLQATIVGNR